MVIACSSALFETRLFALAFMIPGAVWWPYFGGTVALAIGLAFLPWRMIRYTHGLDRLTPWGPLFFAIAMAIFGADHFVAARFVAMIVPPWMPWHLFWSYFVGLALVAAALSLTTNVQSRLAGLLLGVMIFLFVLMIHLPNLMAVPHNNIRLTIFLRDLSLSGGAIAFGAAAGRGEREQLSGSSQRWRRLRKKLVDVARYVVAIPIAVFGIDQFFNPSFVPGIPQENASLFMTLPAWIPAHAFWSYLSGAIFMVCAFGMMSRKHASWAAKLLGATVVALTLLIYVPLTVAKASDVADGLNYLAIHLALAGSALFLAGAIPAEAAEMSAVDEVENATSLRASGF
jgi:uncharacterized membrane protein